MGTAVSVHEKTDHCYTVSLAKTEHNIMSRGAHMAIAAQQIVIGDLTEALRGQQVESQGSVGPHQSPLNVQVQEERNLLNQLLDRQGALNAKIAEQGRTIREQGIAMRDQVRTLREQDEKILEQDEKIRQLDEKNRQLEQQQQLDGEMAHMDVDSDDGDDADADGEVAAEANDAVLDGDQVEDADGGEVAAEANDAADGGQVQDAELDLLKNWIDRGDGLTEIKLGPRDNQYPVLREDFLQLYALTDGFDACDSALQNQNRGRLYGDPVNIFVRTAISASKDTSDFHQIWRDRDAGPAGYRGATNHDAAKLHRELNKLNDKLKEEMN